MLTLVSTALGATYPHCCEPRRIPLTCQGLKRAEGHEVLLLATTKRARARTCMCAPSPRTKKFAFLIAALRPNFRFISLRGEIV